MNKKLNLGLFGFGCVGQGLYHVLNESVTANARIKKICIKNPQKSRSLPKEIFTVSREDLLRDPDIDVIVELIDDPEAAFEILKLAMQSSKIIVTANKRMLANHLSEIVELQRTYECPVLYEAAVCGSIPIIRNLEEYFDNDQLERVEGIFNGSTNYILTRLSEGGKSFEEALLLAQRLGFAESDPGLDVKGIDSVNKLTILLAHTFGILVTPAQLVRIGIERISSFDLAFAKSQNLTIKLVAGARRCGNKVVGFVAPHFVRGDHPLHGVRNEFNAVIVEGAFAEEQLFVGKGAGGNPTGAAVLSDIAALHHGYRYGYKKLGQAGLTYSMEACVEVLVSFSDPVRISTGEFIDFQGGIRSKQHHQMRGVVSLETIAGWSAKEEISIIIAPGAVLHGLAPVKRMDLALA